jgi:diguanylate cyclase (GGDEF)-like protein
VDLLLYQLNISGLTVTTVLIALFFAVLRRSVRRAEMRWWVHGWVANVAALVITSLFWYFQPSAQYFGIIFAFYLAAKFTYVWLLSRGALEFRSERPPLAAASVIIPLLAAVSVLAAPEAVAYRVNVALPPSLGIGAEWLLAMGMVIAVSARTQRDLQNANVQMEAAQSDLRRLVDRDPLTGLANRRALPEVLRTVQPEGAVLIFFDLNDFKKINDEHGHQAGDACLRRFAEALMQCFRPSDAVVRYGGDEFLVVARGVTETAAYERADSVRTRVANVGGGVLPIRFSVGISRLEAGGNPEDAVREADEAMYRAKRKRAPARPRTEMAPQLPLS